MTSIHKLGLILAIALAIAPVPTLARQSPEKVRLDDKSKDGAVMLQVEGMPFGYSLQMSKDGKSGFLSRVYALEVPFEGLGPRYIARTLPPGRYRIDSFWQQNHWSDCLEKATVEFTVVPGRISYLGKLDTKIMFEGLSRRVVASGKQVMRGSDYYQSHGEADGPRFDARDEASLTKARDFAEQRMNRGGDRVDLAELRDTNFGTSAMGKAVKVCG